MPGLPKQQQNDLVTYFARVQKGHIKKVSSEGDKKAAAQAQTLFKTLGEDQKLDFFQKWKENKGKGWVWVRTFEDTLKKTSVTEEGMEANYMTRTSKWSVGWGAHALLSMNLHQREAKSHSASLRCLSP